MEVLPPPSGLNSWAVDRLSSWKSRFYLWRRTEGKNQTLVGAIPFCGEYPGPRFEDKFRSANQIDGISIADGGKMADSKFVNKKTCEIRCYIYKQKCIQ